MRYLNLSTWLLAFVAALCLSATGCSPKTDAAKKPVAKAGGGHDHPSNGPNGGTLIEWGDEEYHPEFTVDHAAKQVVIFILDGTAKKAPKAEAAKITDVKLTITNTTPPVTVDVKHDAAKSGDKGIAFVATHDAFAKETEFKGNLTGKVDGKSFSGDFAEK